MTVYGNSSLDLPVLYKTDIPYQWADSTWFSIAEVYYNRSQKLALGLITVFESIAQPYNFQIFRSNVLFHNFKVFTLMNGFYMNQNVFFVGGDNYNKTIILDNVDLSIDGYLMKNFIIWTASVTNSRVNMTILEAFIFLRYTDPCVANFRGDQSGWLIFRSNYVYGTNREIQYNFLSYASVDYGIFQNNTFENVFTPMIPNRPYIDIGIMTSCDLANRSWSFLFDSNTFINATNSNIIINFNFVATYLEPRTLTFTNNKFINSTINVDMFQIQVTNTTNTTFSNNYYNNVTLTNGYHILYYSAPAGTLYLQNETVVGCQLDDLHYIVSATNAFISNYSISNTTGSGTITTTSGVIRISQGNNIQISNFTVTNTGFKYGKAISIESGILVNMTQLTAMNNSFAYSNFLQFSQIYQLSMTSITLSNMIKSSSQTNYMVSLQQLQLQKNYSSFSISKIQYSTSTLSLLQISSVIYADQITPGFQKISISQFTLKSISLAFNDPLFQLGSVSYSNLRMIFDQINLQQCYLELGSIFQIQMNILNFTIQNSVFYNNTGQTLLVNPSSTNTSTPMVTYIKNSNFSLNNGQKKAMFQITTNSILNVTQSNFLGNFNIDRGSIILADYKGSLAYFYNSSFINNYAFQGGVFYTQYSSKVFIYNCLLLQNFAVLGGVGVVDNDGTAIIDSGSQIIQNTAINTCILFLINTQYQSAIQNSIITQNDQWNAFLNKDLFLSYKVGVSFLQTAYFTQIQTISSRVQKVITLGDDYATKALASSLIISNCSIYNNDQLFIANTNSYLSLVNTSISNISSNGIILYSIQSSVTISNVSILNISNPIGPTTKIQILSSSTLSANNFNISSVAGPLIYATESDISVNNSLISNIYNVDPLNPLISISSGDINFMNTSFMELSSSVYSPLISLSDNTMTLSNSNISSFDKSLFSMSGGNYYFDNIDVYNGPSSLKLSTESVIFYASEANLTINQSKFTGITTNYTSPIIYIENDLTSPSITLSINNSSFINNTALAEAGVVYSYNTNVQINSSVFASNAALQGDGGALYLDCPITSMCNYTINNCTFINNSALINGGAIKYTYSRPALTGNNTLLNNRAFYGNQIAAYPISMALQTSNLTRMRRMATILNATQLTSLGFSNVIGIQLDGYQVSGSSLVQNISLALIDEFGSIVVSDNTTQATLTPISSNVTINKQKTVQAVNGILTFDTVDIIAPPGTTIYLQIVSSSIDQAQILKVYPNYNTQNIIVIIKVRLCQTGEYQTSDLKCSVCPDGQYSIGINQTNCISCPSNGICQNGMISVNPGYWRTGTNSSTIYTCLNADACNQTNGSQCSPGYSGNLCDSCTIYNGTYYYRDSITSCAQCQNKKTNSLKILGVIFLVVLFITITIILSIIYSVKNPSKVFYVKNFAYYLQLLAITQQYELNWGNNISRFLFYIGFNQKEQNDIFAIDCLFKENNITMLPQYAKMILICILPLALFFIYILVLLMIKLFKRSSNFTANMKQCAIIILYVILPQIAYLNMTIFNCMDAIGDGKKYMYVDLNVVCWEGNHKYYAYRFGIPILIIWLVGIPIIMYSYLMKHKKKLDQYPMKEAYGFLYSGLKQKYFFWELLLHSLKCFIIIINIFLTEFDPLFRGVVGFIFMAIQIEVLQFFSPYLEQKYEILEVFSMAAAFSFVYGGLFFISDDLSTSVAAIIFLLILAMNMTFILFWIKCMFDINMSRICPCCFKFKNKQLYKADFPIMDLSQSINGAQVGPQMGFEEESLEEQDAAPQEKTDRTKFDQSSRKLKSESKSERQKEKEKVTFEEPVKPSPYIVPKKVKKINMKKPSKKSKNPIMEKSNPDL